MISKRTLKWCNSKVFIRNQAKFPIGIIYYLSYDNLVIMFYFNRKLFSLNQVGTEVAHFVQATSVQGYYQNKVLILFYKLKVV